MKYIPSIAFEEMSGSAKGVTAAKVKGRKFIKNRGYGKAVQIEAVEEPGTDAVDIKSAYEAKHGAQNTGAPKVFFKYFFVNASTGETSVPMQAMVKYAEAAAAEPEPENP